MGSTYLRLLVFGQKESRGLVWWCESIKWKGGSEVDCKPCDTITNEAWERDLWEGGVCAVDGCDSNFGWGKNRGCILKDSMSDKMDHRVCGKELTHVVVNSENRSGLELLSSITGRMDLVRLNPAVYPFTTELPWVHHQSYWNLF